MVIKDILKHYWREDKEIFDYWVKVATSMQDVDLYEYVRQKKMYHYKYPGANMNLLSCSVCEYRRIHDFSGCSMCNYESNDYKCEAYMYVLRKKNTELYSRAIYESFINVRGGDSTPEITEVLTCYDFLNPDEMPEKAKAMLLEEKLFKKIPFFQVFECRATSVCEKELETIKKYVSPTRTKVIIEFGVEVGDEWIRNYWLHKGLSDQSIIKAVELIHKFGFLASADVLIGIPGLSEASSITLFVETIEFLEKIGMDNYIVLPLNRKKKTLQGIIYEELAYCEELNEVGICQKEHTGVPWLYTIINALSSVLEKKPYLSKKIYLAQVLPQQNTVDNITAYNQENCTCNRQIVKCLELYQRERKIEHIFKAKSLLDEQNHSCKREYESLVKLQNKLDIKDNMRIIVEKLSNIIWENQYYRYVNKFENELKLYDRNVIL